MFREMRRFKQQVSEAEFRNEVFDMDTIDWKK